MTSRGLSKKKEGLKGNERLTEDEMEMLMDLEDECKRQGNFERIYPLESNIGFYSQFFGEAGYQNKLASTYLTTPRSRRDKLLG